MATKDNDNKKTSSRSTSKDSSMTTAEAGRKGGEKVLKERGPEFYSEIGRQQGKENNPGNFANRPQSEVRAAAQRGGENSHRGDSKRDSNS